MAQYMNLMSYCRIPGKEADSTQSTSIENSHHIIVIHNDHVSDHLLFHKLEHLLCFSSTFSLTY